MRVSFIFLVPWANADFFMQGSSWQTPKVKNGPCVASHLGNKWTIPNSSPPPLPLRECSVTVNLMHTLTLSPVIEIRYVEPVFTIMTRVISYLPTTIKKLLFYLCWMYWTALVHAPLMLMANWWAFAWLWVTGPVVLNVGSGIHSSPGGVSYCESSESDYISSHLWGDTISISKFQWITQVLPTTCHGLMVYTGRFGCHSMTTYFVFSQQFPILYLPPNAFCQTRQGLLGSSLEALIFQP